MKYKDVTLVIVCLYSIHFNSLYIESACSPGTFGSDCSYVCKCLNNSPCDEETGECLEGCGEDGWGPGCLLDNECTYNDPSAKYYIGKKSVTIDGDQCQDWTLQLGYPDRNFPDKSRSKAGNFCRNPEPMEATPWCFFHYGELPRDRKWHYCHLDQCSCPVPRWGVNCKEECHCKESSEICEQSSGYCPSGCSDRWTGSSCQDCAAGYFGLMCRQECHCYHGDVCNPVDGSCLSGCAAGWMGSDCQTPCASGLFGLMCEWNCNCANTTEVCNKTSGQCVSGCKPGYTGTDCLTQIPSLSRAPRLRSKTLNTLRVMWFQWDSRRDQGAGPISSYKVLYQAEGQTQWRNVTALRTDCLLTDLTPDTTYIIKVQPITSDGVAGFPSPELSARTCAAVSSGVASLIARPASPLSAVDDSDVVVTDVVLMWQAPLTSASECRLNLQYKVFEWRKSNWSLLATTKEDRYMVRNVSVYFNTTLAISVVTDDRYESHKVTTTFVGRSGPVRTVRLTPSTRALHLSWQPPATPNGPVQVYLVRYQTLAVSGCPNRPPHWNPLLDLSPDSKDMLLGDLAPWSVYKVQVWARTAAGDGMRVDVDNATLSDAPSGAVRDFRQTELTANYTQFKWDLPACSDRNGPFLAYHVTLFKVPAPAVAVQFTVVNTSWVVLENLVPFTDYVVSVSYVNDVGPGPEHRHQFTTLESVPLAPTNLTVMHSYHDKLLVAWDPPHPPHGVLVGYQVRVLNGSVDVAVEGGRQEVTVTGLQAYTGYSLAVRARTKIGYGEWSAPATGTTDEYYPSQPLSLVNVSRSDRSISLKWRPPLKANGILREYQISCFARTILGQMMSGRDRDRDATRFIDSSVNEYTMNDLIPGTGYGCWVSAITKPGKGEAAKIDVYTTPEKPAPPPKPVIDSYKMTNTSVVISISKGAYTVNNDEHSLIVYLVVVEVVSAPPSPVPTTDASGRVRRSVDPASLPCGQDHRQLSDYHQSKTRSVSCYVIARLTSDQLPRSVTAGDGGLANPPLQTGSDYRIWIGLVVTVDGVTNASFTSSEVVTALQVSPPQDILIPSRAFTPMTPVAIVVAVVIVIVIVVLFIVFILRRNRNNINSQRTDSDRLASSPKVSGYHERSSFHVSTDSDEDSADLQCLIPRVCPSKPRNPISVDDLWQQLRELKANNSAGYKEEYEDIPFGLVLPHDTARKPENKQKNRYMNIVAYDHTRVVLECLPNDPHSDYINANFVDAYYRPCAWIATQGPTKFTFVDFWRLIWQQSAHRIVMVTNLVEDGRHKCDCYWPDTQPKEYGAIRVEKLEEEQYADFTIRTFSVTNGGEQERIIRQFHFTSWPDHGCPTYATSILAFRKKVRSFDDPTAGPTVIHCSAGVGRTGTFIALDSLLDQARTEGIVDVFNWVKGMRQQRVNMIQTQEQYEFVYEALLEALKSGETAIPSRDFAVRFEELLAINPDTGKQKLEEEFELLRLMSPTASSTCKAAVDPENVSKNRNQAIIPLGNAYRPFLLTEIPGSTDYINAVFADGYKHRDAYIITQNPLPHTRADFWAMMYDYECSAIIMMQEGVLPPSECYYPLQAGSLQFGPFTVETVELDSNFPDITIRDMKLTPNKKAPVEPRRIRQFQYHGWTGSLPVRKLNLIELLHQLEKWQQRNRNKTVVVHCLDGASQSGLLCALSYMIERLKVEQEVDIFTSVKHVRINRPQLVPTMEQYRFLYDMAEEYIQQFDTYANFK